VLGLRGGDLCKTLGGRGDAARLRSPDAVTFPIDIAEVEVHGTSHFFVAHLVLRNRLWTRVTAVMNASLLGPWNPAPKAHPNDGLLDVLDARLRLGDLRAVRSRLPLGAHLPHPRIRHSRVAAIDLDADRRRLWLDGTPVEVSGPIRVTVHADALRVVV
jgi:diacylglycerol kinase family enzyme